MIKDGTSIKRGPLNVKIFLMIKKALPMEFALKKIQAKFVNKMP
jgi:hypothetical protein